MAYLLLAIGALMSVAGAYLGITGYHIVQVEEGWSSVIAGATFFVGGFVTMALGLVLRTLLQLQTAMVGRPIPAPAPNDAAAPPLLAMPPSFPDANVGTQRQPEMRGESDARFETKIEPQVEDGLRPDRKVRAAPLVLRPSIVAPSVPALPSSASVLPVPDHVDPIILASPEDSPPLDVPAIGSTTGAPAHGVTEPEDVSRQPEDDYELETPSTAEHDLITPDHDQLVPVEPAPAPQDDWLDRAFAEFDHDLPKSIPSRNASPDAGLANTTPSLMPEAVTPSPAAPILPRPVLPPLAPPKPTLPRTVFPKINPLPWAKPIGRPAPTDPEPAYAGLDDSRELGDVAPAGANTAILPSPHAQPLLPEPASPEFLHPATADSETRADEIHDPAHIALQTPALQPPVSPPAPSGPAAAVIGRYESEGTSYVMYADGSIEAHSDAGVYRFASMAELKAFIEG